MTHFIVAAGILYLNESILVAVINGGPLLTINKEETVGGGCDLVKYLVIYYISSYTFYIV